MIFSQNVIKSTEEKFNTNLFYKNSGEVQAADPHVIYAEDKFYMYYSCQKEGEFQHLHVSSSNSPLGPFTVTTLLSTAIVTLAGIEMGNFPILDITLPPINKHNTILLRLLSNL